MNLDLIKNNTKWEEAANSINSNFNKTNLELTKIAASSVKHKGYFTTEAALLAAQPSPKVGDNAYVGATYPGVVYICNTAGIWTATTTVPSPPAVSLSEYYNKTETDAIVATVESNINSLETDLNKKVNSKLGKNRFDKNSIDIISNSYLNSGANIMSNSSYSITGYIPIHIGETLFCNSSVEGGSVYNAQYDSDYNLIPLSAINSKKASYKNGACYVRFTFISSQINSTQIEVGQAATDYVEFTELGELVINSSISDGAVNEQKTVFFDKTKNLFNPNDQNVAYGYYVSHANGNIAPSASYNASGYIPVEPNQYYTMSFIRFIAWYDINKVYIIGVDSTVNNNLTQQAPANAYYIRCSISLAEFQFFQIEKGTTKTGYIPYGYVIKDKYLTGKIASVFKNDIIMPSKLYMLSGTQNNIFVEPFIKRWRPYNYVARFSGTASYQRRLEKVASITSPTDGSTVKIDLINTDNFSIEKTSISIITVGTKSIGQNNVYASIIGDSLVNGKFFEDALLINGYTPNLKLVGLREVDGHVGQYDEGRGGWKLSNYLTVTFRRTEAYNGFMQPNGEYKYWGSTHFWKLANDIRLNPSGPWTFDEGYNAGRFSTQSLKFDSVTGFKLNPLINDIMYNNDISGYVIYNGSQWIPTTYSSYTWTFNYSKYLSMWEIPTPSILFVFLGLNDFRGAETPELIDFTLWNQRMTTIINSYLTAVQSGKFVIMTPNSTCGSLDNSSGDFTVKFNAAMWAARKNIIDVFDNRESENIYVLDIGITIDNLTGYNYSTDLNYTNPYNGYQGDLNFNVQVGNPHPYPNYPTMGIPIAAFIQKYRS